MPRYGKLDAQGVIVEEIISDESRAGYVELDAMAVIGDKRAADGRFEKKARAALPEIEPDYDPASDLGKAIKAKKDKLKGV